jgi:ppGpp synthetase/RelA/SpoT-type nucleotidyltranferase
MAFATRKHSSNEIDKAGRAIVSLPKGDPARAAVIDVISNWRACHGYPLHIAKRTLIARAKRINESAVIAHRIKRLRSISTKLSHNPTMRLSRVQDIGGCRVIFGGKDGIESVGRLVSQYEMSPPHGAAIILEKKTDYIANPKPDGYRGVHLITEYRSDLKPEFRGQRIEIQVRTDRQHAWATAVETSEFITQETFKSKVKTIGERWQRFFRLMSSEIATLENRPIVAGTPENQRDRRAELREINESEGIVTLLAYWAFTVMRWEARADAYLILLEMNTKTRQLAIRPFTREEIPEAEESYFQRERETEEMPEVQIVLVGVESIASLRTAYPNYWADTHNFLMLVTNSMGTA